MYLSCVIVAVAAAVCSAIPTPKVSNCNWICFAAYMPVCGSDDVTYENDCKFKMGQCRNPDLRVMHHGECEELNPSSCQSSCPQAYQPVCASNGQTFSNGCELENHNCRYPDDQLSIVSDGPCVQFPEKRQPSMMKCNRICTADYRPVCGSDNVTYGNDCQFRIGQCRNPDLRAMHRGECQELNPSSCQSPCPQAYQPVCASNGQTFSNGCELENHNCRYPDDQLSIVSDGPCVQFPEKRQPSMMKCNRICTADYRPVCGSDNVTYGNDCQFRIGLCRNPDLRAMHRGECQELNPSSCQSPCPQAYQPVCASNGQTFSNGCELENHNCRYPDDQLSIVSDGPCVQFPEKRQPSMMKCNRICTADYRPVCGSDNVTYGNDCQFRIGQCRNPDLRAMHRGECQELNPSSCQSPCPQAYQPVCASNGQTFSNGCELENHNCRYPDDQLSIVSDGPCVQFPEKRQPSMMKCNRICTADYRPVCGNDNVTYGNDCQFRIGQCRNPDLRAMHRGECQELNPSSCQSPCPQAYQPVCASNGQTFSNGCELENHNCRYPDDQLSIVSDGPCVQFPEKRQPSMMKCNRICTADYRPVCGSDNVTYGNDCQFRIGLCRNPDLQAMHRGECQELNPSSCQSPCPQAYQPVCASNGQTFSNGCELENHNCRYPDDQLSIVFDGPCVQFPEKRQPSMMKCNRICTADYRPVCGSDNVTYGNDCQFRIGQCRNPDLRAMHRGECQELSSCQSPCPQAYQPVCASNGQTFSNGCELENHNCRYPDDQLSIVSDGPCVQFPEKRQPSMMKCNRICTADYRPVCGSDNVTYGNDCQFRIGQCRNPDLRAMHRGECQELNPSSCQSPCPQAYQPVCASNGQTFSNGCELENHNCRYPDDQLSIVSDGPCVQFPEKRQPSMMKCNRICTADYRPVCGSDNVTYGNDCQFRIGQCRNPDLRAMHRGECQELNPSSCQSPCPQAYQPVCASNGQTFSNGCELENHNCRYPDDQLSIVSDGPCVQFPEKRQPSMMKCNRICTADYRPVCGSDNVTYGNDCQFRIGQCRNPDLRAMHRGECQELNPSSCQSPCPQAYQPVCASNGQTFSNGCELENHNCRYPDDQLSIVSDGPCQQRPQQRRPSMFDAYERTRQKATNVPRGGPVSAFVACFRPCPRHFRPVCGSNKVTYANRCIFNVANCRMGGTVSVVKAGRCLGRKSTRADPRIV